MTKFFDKHSSESWFSLIRELSEKHPLEAERYGAVYTSYTTRFELGGIQIHISINYTMTSLTFKSEDFDVCVRIEYKSQTNRTYALFKQLENMYIEGDVFLFRFQRRRHATLVPLVVLHEIPVIARDGIHIYITGTDYVDEAIMRLMLAK